MNKELHPHWRSTEPETPQQVQSGDQKILSPHSSVASQAEKGEKKMHLTADDTLWSGRKLSPLSMSLMASIGIIVLVSLFASGLRNLTAQLVEEGAATLRVTTQGLSPSELSLSVGDVLMIEWLHPTAGTVQSKEKNSDSQPLLKTAELQMGDKERITISAEWTVAELTLEASVHPGVTAAVLLAEGEGRRSTAPVSPQQPIQPPVPVSPSPAVPTPAPEPPPALIPTPPIPTPVPIPSSPTPLEATLEAPILPRVTTVPTLRINRFTVGSPLVPEGALPPVPFETLAGVHGAAPLHGITYPELVLTPPTTVPGQEFIPPPPSPRVRRQPETGPFLGGLVAVCAVASAILVGRGRVKRSRRKKKKM